MANASLINNCPVGKNNGTYSNMYESLCAKIKQASAVANIAATNNPTEHDLFHTIWCLSDLLRLACDECEQLRAEDVKEIRG